MLLSSNHVDAALETLRSLLAAADLLSADGVDVAFWSCGDVADAGGSVKAPAVDDDVKVRYIVCTHGVHHIAVIYRIHG